MVDILTVDVKLLCGCLGVYGGSTHKYHKFCRTLYASLHIGKYLFSSNAVFRLDVCCGRAVKPRQWCRHVHHTPVCVCLCGQEAQHVTLDGGHEISVVDLRK